ncbi:MULTISPECIES: DUF2997 domain-containing protein [unclassified Microcystis]|jgi:hypothetical protein|uniref:DUF2997 domain-containing protein n=1 Tax=unclassified Microcystis TaxID=2643300 RepID=UPI00258333BE|nr:MULTISPECIES: DUF2997 domain-containing protein [unclassified Microcystis]MCA2761772.1 DUF2997 domain-containing protein [Microcystis sp. M151S2]NCQ86103.1 DUF2997 domain-containing protein [Microcystis aeruginosa W13-18]NCR37007.1 DUF2997 domain-containing protein [Microcystis aeruginosa S11-05]NCR50536.1 DUF2997 domain-containing protein [Microcystis aeruginosa S11-01]MCA2641630.1 DUF2997 domain-containing protein [Microcystis sp. M087S2]
MSKKIQLRIFPDGRVQAEVQGIKGKACTDYIEILEEVLNAEVYESSYTPEYYENQEVWLSQQIDETVNDRS